jgi:hypothetical protein
MVEPSVWWGIILGSHIFRSIFWESDRAEFSALQSDIATLRVEVHRARDLISGYNEVLEACESSAYWLKWANSCLCWLVICILLILVFGAWWIQQLKCDKGGKFLSVKEEATVSLEGDRQAVAVIPGRVGPAKPSTFGKGKP